MTITIPGCSTLTGRPVALLRLLRAARVTDSAPLAETDGVDINDQAEIVLRELARDNKITINEEE